MIFYKDTQNLSGRMFFFFFLFSYNANFYNTIFIFTNQRENKITDRLASIQTIIMQMLLCL